MGAVSFSLDYRLLEEIKDYLPLSLFFETGTFHGDTVAAAIPYFTSIYSAELSETLYLRAQERFEKTKKVHLLQGNSPSSLKKMQAELAGQPVLYWLDTHWCLAENTAGQVSQCPLLQELEAISHLNNQSIILIDDARLFMAPPPPPHEITQWPTFHQILKCFMELSSHHEISVINDVIAFYPKQARSGIYAYARKYSTDWGAAYSSLDQAILLQRELEVAQAQLEEKDLIIQSCLAHLKEKEQLIQEQHQSLLSMAPSPLSLAARRLARPFKRIYTILRPRLGHLNQYSPRPISLPASHSLIPQLEEWPSISLVTPSFQQAGFIERTLLSVLSQDYPHLEYVVQDGGSTDGAVDILKRYADRLTSWHSQPDSGQSEAINRGFSQTTGDIMGWLNSDDILLPGALAFVADFFNKHPEIDVVYGHRILMDEHDQQIGRWIMPAHDNNVLSWADYIPQETLFWRRTIWEKAGSHIDESFRFAMDWDLLIRFREAGARFARLPRFLGGFRIHAHQKTSAAISQIGYQEMERIRLRVLGYKPSCFDIKKAVVGYLMRHVVADLWWRIKNKLGRS